MATPDDQLRVPVAAALALVVAVRVPVAAAALALAAVAPVGMAGSVAAGDVVAHHSRRHVLSAKRCAQQGQ